MDIDAAALGGTWDAFRGAMAAMRKTGHAVTHAEVDPGCIGIGAPVFDDRTRILGSLSYVIPLMEEQAAARLGALIAAAAREIGAAMKTGSR